MTNKISKTSRDGLLAGGLTDKDLANSKSVEVDLKKLDSNMAKVTAIRMKMRK